MSRELGRIPELDALRGIAALLIVLFHVRFNGMFPAWGSMVDLFFVLSGFLITGILFEHGDEAGFLPKFYVRRALRILPIYYLTFPLFLAMNAVSPRPASLAALTQHLTYTQFVEGYAFAPIRYLGIHYRHTWTLAIEEQFYLFWPIVALALGKRRLPYVLLPMLAAPSVCRVLGFFPHLLITRCDGLVLGSILAWVPAGVQRGRLSSSVVRNGSIAVMFAASTFVLYRSGFYSLLAWVFPRAPWPAIRISLDVFRLAAFHAGLTGLVVIDQGKPYLAVLRRPRLVWLGKISYGLYLYHPFVGAFFGLLHYWSGMRGSVLSDALRVVGSIALAGLSWQYIEAPILRLKDRFAYSKRVVRGPHAPRRAAEPIAERSSV